MTLLLTTQKIHNVIMQNKFPAMQISLGNFVFTLTCSAEEIPSSFINILDYFEPLILAQDSTTRIYRGKEFLTKLPASLFLVLLEKYVDFQNKELSYFLSNLTTYVESNESKHAWDIFKSVGVSYIFSNKPLNILQRQWIQLNINKDRNNSAQLIKNIFEAAKPWLNQELYVKLKEAEENTRTNYQFDDDELDARLQKQAAETIKQRKIEAAAKIKDNVSDDDIIELVED